MNNLNLENYFPIIVFFAVATILSTIIVILPRFLARQNPQKDKLSSYECGFEAIGEAHNMFDVKFYIVAILFIIFDLEIMFLIPWAVSLGKIGLFGFYSMMCFLTVLTIGFIYEWKKGALDW
jgi:NADH-quinone oxidoreductase subunit A